jgi:hypothetical protein
VRCGWQSIAPIVFPPTQRGEEAASGRGGRIGGDALVYDYEHDDDGAHYGGIRELMRTLFR